MMISFRCHQPRFAWSLFKIILNLKFQFEFKKITQEKGDRGSTVVKVLCYKSNSIPASVSGFFIDIKFYGPGVDSAYNRNEYQGYFLGVKAAVPKADNLPPSCAVCHKIWET